MVVEDGWTEQISTKNPLITSRLDHFFLLLGAFEVLALINYTFWARRYARKLRRISTVETHEDDTRN